MRSHAKAPSVGSVCAAATSALVAVLFVFAFAASSASAAVSFVGVEAATEVKKDSAVLNGYFGNDGQEAHYFFEWGETEAYGHTTPASPGAGIPGSGFEAVPPITISGLLGGTTYHYRLAVSDPDGTVTSEDATFTTSPTVDNVKAESPTSVTETSAELNGSFDGDGTNAADYYFEWGPTTAYGNTTPAPPGNSVPAASGTIHVPPVAIGGLEGEATYHYRLVVKSPAGAATASADATFKADPDAPNVFSVRSAKVKETSAELLGSINPRYGQTSYHFEWGPTAAYGNSTPVPDGNAGATNTGVPVSVGIGGLNPGVTYHFRLVATNQYGTTASPDQTFGFYPPACPNSQVRQETRSNHLPDCRAYELVSPSFAQGAVIMPGSGPTSGVATNPARLMYGVNFGLFAEETGEGMNSINDLYVSTRTDGGWTQRYIGLPATQGIFMGGPVGGFVPSADQGVNPVNAQRGTQGSPSLDRVINYNWGFPGHSKLRSPGSNGPYVWDTATGTLLERWPTNLAETPGAEHFVGFPQASADLSHFVFSSNVVFAAGGEASGGELECCGLYTLAQVWPEASVYDNDIATGSVVLASRTKAGVPFQGRVFDISADGSHILMTRGATLDPTTNGRPAPLEPKEAIIGAQIPGPLYLRVDDSQTYEIAPGHQIQYAGGTTDGATVYLTSDEQLTPDDHDSSRDLFVWHQSDPNSLTRISIGDHGNAGNTDECSPNDESPAEISEDPLADHWIAACGVSVVPANNAFAVPGYVRGAADSRTGNGHSDNAIASANGDIYLESPEQLLGSKGEPNERNLYLYRNGTLRFVATLRANAPIVRMQVTSDGRYMALVTDSRLTDYQGGGMYRYDAEAGRIACASCRPDGQPSASPTLPTKGGTFFSPVRTSKNGLFLINDGRVFFSTTDPLVPRDSNHGEDVYEFTEGKAQLITTGIGSPLETYIGGQTSPGLVSVSANGNDVYFATIDTLVTQDHNGAQIKVYDARTGGGFPAEREEPKCTAADECHGPTTDAPARPADRTRAGLASPRKTKAHKAKKHKKAHKHKKAKKHKKKRAAKAKRKPGSAKQGGKHHG